MHVRRPCFVGCGIQLKFRLSKHLTWHAYIALIWGQDILPFLLWSKPCAVILGPCSTPFQHEPVEEVNNDVFSRP